jgi:hypothetical protein
MTGAADKRLSRLLDRGGKTSQKLTFSKAEGWDF